MKIAMLYYNFLDPSGSHRVIGGVETYLWNLSRLVAERGDEPLLFQSASRPFDRQLEHLRIIGVEPRRKRLRTHIRRDLYDCAMSHLRGREGGVLVFGADIASVRSDFPRSLSIQHGIGWDLPARLLRPTRFQRVPLVPDSVFKRYMNYRAKLYFANSQHRVCVDYNFMNWYRTQSDKVSGRTWIIPNFVDTPASYSPDLQRHSQTSVRVLFARRFVEMRGTKLMVEAARQLLPAFPELEICFAGEGPDKCSIADAFYSEPRVTICKYLPDDSLNVHSRFHIAVIPSLASEGTSLSLAEAMAAGCAVVATNVGGMTNMVIDGYNGRLVDPTSASLVAALAELVRDSQLRRRLGQRASETSREAFSLCRWKERWSEVLDHVQSIPL